MYQIAAFKSSCTSCVRHVHSVCPAVENQSILKWYRAEIARGELRQDAKQLVLIDRLDKLSHSINAYEVEKPSLFGRFFRSSNSESKSPKGLYVYGDVGTGKTMLMDKFYETLNVTKQRIHFHDFMLNVHEKIHDFKLSIPPSYVKERRSYDPIPAVAKIIATQSSLLCFDEFQVTDVADAMILKRLFETLFAEKVIMVATCNRPPEDLYKNGLQRTNFLPFIPLLKLHCDVLDIDSVVDYRLSDTKPLDIPGGEAFIVNDPSRLDIIFDHLTRGREAKPRTLSFLGRDLTIGISSEKVLLTTYKEVCESPLSSADFRALAKEYTHILIRDFPQLSMTSKTPLRRFIVMMDTFYDKQVKLVISSNVDMSQLFNMDYQDKLTTDELRMLMDDLRLTVDQAAQMNLFTGEEELFSHKRALSRLNEMQCGDYWSS